MSFLLPGIRPGPWDRRVVGRWRGMGRRPRSSPGTREACTWRRGPASRQCGQGNARRPPVNTGEPELTGLYSAERRVLEIQAKLHRWAGEDPHRRFDDLFNLVADPALLLVAWDRVGVIRGRARLGWTARPPATSRPCGGWRGSGALTGCPQPTRSRGAADMFTGHPAARHIARPQARLTGLARARLPQPYTCRVPHGPGRQSSRPAANLTRPVRAIPVAALDRDRMPLRLGQVTAGRACARHSL